MKSGGQSSKWRHKLRDFLSLSVSCFVIAVVSTSRATFEVLEEATTALATMEIRPPSDASPGTSEAEDEDEEVAATSPATGSVLLPHEDQSARRPHEQTLQEEFSRS